MIKKIHNIQLRNGSEYSVHLIYLQSNSPTKSWGYLFQRAIGPTPTKFLSTFCPKTKELDIYSTNYS